MFQSCADFADGNKISQMRHFFARSAKQKNRDPHGLTPSLLKRKQKQTPSTSRCPNFVCPYSDVIESRAYWSFAIWRQGNFDIAPSSPFWRHRPRGYLTKDSVYWFFRRWRHRNFDIDPLNRKGLSNARRLEVHWTFLYSRQVIYIRVSWSRSEFYSRRHVSEFLLSRECSSV